MLNNDIYSYITTEVSNYEHPIDLMGWSWSMKDHVKTAFYYKNGRLLSGNADYKPVKNIVRPILNLQYRTEDLDVTDITLYVKNAEFKRKLKSFFVKKYYENVFLQKHNLDDFLDFSNEDRITYGGALLYDNGSPIPEVIPLDNIAFCNQRNLLGGPLCFYHEYSPDKLMEMEEKHWGDKKFGATVTLEELIVLALEGKTDEKEKLNGVKVYELHGNLPEKFLKNGGNQYKYVPQTQIAAFYQNQKGDQEGVTLFKAKSKPLTDKFKVALRDPINGRALGFGGVEEIEEPQVWVNYSQLKFRELLDSAAKVVYKTTSPAVANMDKVKKAKNQEAILLEPDEDVSQINTFPSNIQLFDQYVREWETHAGKLGAANESIMGETPKAGTPFKLQELITAESHGLHEWRRGKFAKVVEEVFRDWILPHIEKEIKKDTEFIAELDMDEMQFLASEIADYQVNQMLDKGQLDEGEAEAKKQEIIADFMQDNSKLLKWAGNMFKETKLAMNINVAGKQKNLPSYADKLVNIFRQIASAPQLLNDPRMSKIFNKILEASGLEPMEFGALKMAAPVKNTEAMGEMATQMNENIPGQPA